LSLLDTGLNKPANLWQVNKINSSHLQSRPVTSCITEKRREVPGIKRSENFLRPASSAFRYTTYEVIRIESGAIEMVDHVHFVVLFFTMQDPHAT